MGRRKGDPNAEGRYLELRHKSDDIAAVSV
jgi:hypothetical protein